MIFSTILLKLLYNYQLTLKVYTLLNHIKLYIIGLLLTVSPLIAQIDSLSLETLKPAGKSDSAQVLKGYPVISNFDTLFYIYTGVLNYTPQQRAKIVSEKLDFLKSEYDIRVDSLKIAKSKNFVDIFFKDQVVLRLTNEEAIAHGESKEFLAEQFVKGFERKIQKYKEERSLFETLKQAGISVGVLMILLILIRSNNRLFKKLINKKLLRFTETVLPKIKIKDYEILESKILKRVVLFGSTLTQYFINLILIYVALPIIFSIFPDTKNFSNQLIALVLNPLKTIFYSFIDFIPNLITIAVIVFIVHYSVKFVRYLLDGIKEEKIKIHGFYPDWASTTFNLIRIFAWLFAFIVIFPYLPGSNSDAFQGVTVFIGLIVSLGSTSIIGNLIAGVVITYMRPFLIGDMIKVGDKLGSVVQKTTFAIKLRTQKKELITIPNSTILTSEIVNLSASNTKSGIILYSTVTIGYDVPWRKVHELLINAAKKTSNTMEQPEPFVLQTSLDDSYISYQINVYTDKPVIQAKIYSELHQNVQDEFNKAGVEIMSPHYSAARDGNRTTIPDENLPKDYEPPFFRFLFKNSDK